MMKTPFLVASILIGAATVTPAIAAGQPAAHERDRGTVREETFFSPALGVTKRMAVYLPPSYASQPNRRYPVALYLHGLTGTETDWLSRAGLDAIADSLVAIGMPEMIIAMPDGDDGWYSDWAEPANYAACADSSRGESATRFCVHQAKYETYVVRDVVGVVDSRFRTRADRAHRGIAGLSMGGYGAIELALRHPDVFAAAASHSGVVSPLYVGPRPFTGGVVRYATTLEEARTAPASFFDRYVRFWGANLSGWLAADPAHTAERQLAARVALPALALDCGVDDPFIDQNRALDAELTRLGVVHRFTEYPGAHTWRYWTTHAPQSMAWLASEIAR
ncbi:MAG TPA: alpha/beta hydrolase family protein [Gemmatimonadaceae bacterium]